LAVTSKDLVEREQQERAEAAQRGRVSMAAAIANAGGGQADSTPAVG
jgi:hypothetical protein